ncbi:MAG: PcfJ domain-containing protein [Clostridium sp.]
MTDKEIVNIIKNYRIITNIFEENHQCEECGRELTSNNIQYGDITNTFKCECGEHFVFANESEVKIYTSYEYEYVGKFIITKKSYYEKVDLNEKRFLWDKSKAIEENLIFNLREVNGCKVINFKYFNSEQPFMEHVNECGSFFNDFTLEDFKEMANKFSILCIENRVKPNYGEMLSHFCMGYNMMNYLGLFKLIFTNSLLEYLIKWDMTYLIEKNPVKAIDQLTKKLQINNNGNSLKAIFNIPNKGLNHIRNNRLGVYSIISLREFFQERNAQEFSIIVKDYSFALNSLGYIRTLLNNGYKIRKLCEYVVRISESEDLSTNEVFIYLNDLRRMSKAIDISFKPYSKNLKERHDRVLGVYNVQKNEIRREELLKATKNFEIKQVGSEYYAKPLKTIEDFKYEGEIQKNCVMSYIDYVLIGQTQIFSVRKLDNVSKPYATIELKNNTIVQAKFICNRPVDGDMKQYLTKLAFENDWNIR